MNITNSVVIVCAPSGREPQIFRNDPPQNIRNLHRARRLVYTVLDAIRYGVREQSNGAISVDVAAVTTSMLSEYADQRAPGLYARATIGTGYICAGGSGQCEASAWEELGVGYRWPVYDGRFLLGPHVIASGLLHQILTPGFGANHLFAGVGASLNLYRLLDVSVTEGGIFDLVHGPSPEFGVFVGLQLPIADYVSALTAGSTSPQTTTGSAQSSTPTTQTTR